MAISHKTQNRWDSLSARLRDNDGRLSLNECDDYLEILAQNAEGTNGLKPEEKLQAISEGLFNLTYLFIRDKLEAQKPATSWKDVLIKCSWQTVVVVAITVPSITFLFVYQPQLAAILEHFIK